MKIFLLTLLLLAAGCGKDQPDVKPGQTEFQMTGKHIYIKGQLKPGTAVTIAEIKAALKASLNVLEK